MVTHRWLGISSVIAITAVFSACSSSKQGATTTSGSSSSGSAGGRGGAGGAGGNGGVGGTTTSAGGSQPDGGTPEAGPITCSSPTAYSSVPEGTCDILQQNCPEGQTCTPSQSGSDVATKCVAASGLKTLGEPCYDADECDAKLFCVDSKCSPVCCRDNNEPCNGGICDLNVGFGKYQAYVCHFSQKCELLTADACPAGFYCHIEDQSQGLATCGEPDPTGISPELGPCSFLNDCDTMQQCYTGNSTCHYYCHLTGGETEAPGLGGCPSGEDCRSTYGGHDIDFGVPGVGLCFPDGSTPVKDAGSDAAQ